MTSLPKIAVIGHWLARDIRDRSIKDLKRNFNLSQCDVKFCWSGDWEGLDFVRLTFDNVFAPFLRSYRPNVDVLQIAGNDVDTYGQTVQTFIFIYLFILFIHYFKRIAHLATLASLPCGPLDIVTYIQIHTI